MEEICDTPAEKLASRDPTDACIEEAWQTVRGKGADFWNKLKCNNRKLDSSRIGF